MATKIAPFTLTDSDICVKCGKDMPEETIATWLREPERKGYYHPACSEKPTIEALTKIKVQAHDSPLGYIWMRVNAIPAHSLLGETTPATQLFPSEAQRTAEVDLISSVAKALLPALGRMVSEAVEKGEPRIVVNVYVAKPGQEIKALDLLSKELFLLNNVQTI